MIQRQRQINRSDILADARGAFLKGDFKIVRKYREIVRPLSILPRLRQRSGQGQADSLGFFGIAVLRYRDHEGFRILSSGYRQRRHKRNIILLVTVCRNRKTDSPVRRANIAHRDFHARRAIALANPRRRARKAQTKIVVHNRDLVGFRIADAPAFWHRRRQSLRDGDAHHLVAFAAIVVNNANRKVRARCALGNGKGRAHRHRVPLRARRHIQH